MGRVTPSGAGSKRNSKTGITEVGLASQPWVKKKVRARRQPLVHRAGNAIGRITPAGQVTEYPLPTADSLPNAIAAGPDGNLWFVETNTDQVGRITPSGAVTEFPIPAQRAPDGIAAGPDGNLWFALGGANDIGRITPSGTITLFPTPTTDSGATSIALGADGNLWFTEQAADDRPDHPGRHDHGVPPCPSPAHPLGITAGPGENMWFTESHENRIGRISAGVATEPTGATGATGCDRYHRTDGKHWRDR